MSEIRKTVDVPAHQEVRTVATVCDLCGRHGDPYGRYPTESDNPYAVDDITVQRRHGASYPGDEDIATDSFDVCPDCWSTRVLPWFQAQGASLTTVTRDSRGQRIIA